MATAQVTVNNAWELHDALVNFLTTDATLVANGEAWTLVSDDQGTLEWLNYSTDSSSGAMTSVINTSSEVRVRDGNGFIEFAFHDPKEASGIRLYFTGSLTYAPLYYWELQSSTDGITWTTVTSNTTAVTDNGNFSYDVTFTSTTAKYWKFVINQDGTARDQRIHYIRLFDAGGTEYSMAYTYSRSTRLVAPVTGAVPQPPAVRLDSLGVIGDTYNWTRAYGYTVDPLNPTNLSSWVYSLDAAYIPAAGNIPQTAYFYANGRRFMVFLDTGTSNESLYFGLLSPVASTNQYRFPCLCAGSGGDSYVPYDSTDDAKHTGFFDPVYTYSLRRRLILPDGSTASFGSTDNSAETSDAGINPPNNNEPARAVVFPYKGASYSGSLSNDPTRRTIGQAGMFRSQSGADVLMPTFVYLCIYMLTYDKPTNPSDYNNNYFGILGQLEGVFSVHPNTPVGTVITIGSDNYRVFGSAHKSAGMSKCAVLEV